MALDHILLGLLQRPATGYELKAAFTESVRHFWSAELSQIYPTLKRLEQRGFLESRVEPSPRGPDRRVYTRSVAGRNALTAWLRGGPVVGTERFTYLAQLFFMDALGNDDETRVFLEDLRAHFVRWLSQMTAFEHDIRAEHGPAPERYPASDFHQFASLRMGIHSIRAKVAWCDETLATLDTRHATSADAPVPQEVEP